MLTIQNLSFAMEGRPLLEDCSLTIPTGHKVGLVGRNGTGKTTLFRLIMGELDADLGSTSVPRGARIGTVAQEAPASDMSLLDTVMEADTELNALHLEAETATDPNRIAEIQLRLADISAHTAEARASSILSGLGFSPENQRRPTREFSGGWRMRVALAAILFSRPDLLLLDEPTNYLDLEGTIWLENYLARYPHTVLLISHDRDLLNRAVGHILHLRARKLVLYTGGYDTFDNARRAQAALAEAGARKQETERAHLQSFVDRFRYKASKAKQAQSRIKRLEKMEPITFAGESQVQGFAFPDPDELAPPIIRLDEAIAGYDGVPILRNLDLRIDPDDRIALLGANGQGKSTLSKLIAKRLAPMSGSVIQSNKLRIGYFAQHQMDELEADETPLEHLAAHRPGVVPAKLRAILASGGIGADIADNPVARLSGGQKARLALLIATLDKPHLVILDEPTNHLDIDSREALVQALTIYSGAVILVSHDPHLVDAVADRLWLVNEGKVTPFEDDMDGYRSFLLKSRGAGGQDSRPAKPRKPKAQPISKSDRKAVKADVRKSEERIEKLEDMRVQIDAKLADPALYDAANAAGRVAALQRKRSEVLAALDKAEAIWMAAAAKLERMQS